MSIALIFFLTLIGGIFLFLCSRNASIGVYLFTILLFLKPTLLHPALAVLHLTRGVAVVTFLFFLFQSLQTKKIISFTDYQTKWLLVFFAAICFSIFSSVWGRNTLNFLFDFLKIILVYFLIINLIQKINQCRTLWWIMVLSMFFITIISIKDYYQSGAVLMGLRMFGSFNEALFGDPNDMALSFTILIPFLYYDLFRGKSMFRKIFQIGILFIFCYAFILTQSRGGFLGLLVMILTIWWRSKKKFTVFAVLIVLLPLIWYMTPQYYKDRIISTYTAADNDESAISRLDAWKAGWNMMTHRIFGVGAGNFREGFVQYRSPNAIDFPGMRRVAHNMFIEVGGETGIPGLLIFIGVITATFLSLVKSRKLILTRRDEFSKEVILLINVTFVSLASYCASGFFLSQAYNFSFYYLVGFSVVLSKLIKKEIYNEKI